MKIHIFQEPVDEIVDIPEVDVTDTAKIDEIVKEYIGAHSNYGWRVVEITPEEQAEWIRDLMKAHEG